MSSLAEYAADLGPHVHRRGSSFPASAWHGLPDLTLSAHQLPVPAMPAHTRPSLTSLPVCTAGPSLSFLTPTSAHPPCFHLIGLELIFKVVSWREEDRPAHLREGPPLTSWAQARWGGGVLPACGVLWSRPGAGSLVPGHPPLGPLYPPPGPCGPPSWRKEQRGHQGGRKELRVGVLPGGIPSAIQGEAPGCAVFIVLAPQPTQTQGDNDRYFTLTPGPLLWVPALDLDFRGGGGVLRALPS